MTFRGVTAGPALFFFPQWGPSWAHPTSTTPTSTHELYPNLTAASGLLPDALRKRDLQPDAVDYLGEELNLDRMDLPWSMVSAKERTNLNELLMMLKAQLISLAEPSELVEPEEELKAVE